MLSSSLATTNRLDPTGTAADASHIPKCLVIGESVPAVTGSAKTMATKMTATAESFLFIEIPLVCVTTSIYRDVVE